MPNPSLSSPSAVSFGTASVRVESFGGRAPRGDTGPEIAILLTAPRDTAATVRCFKTVLPRARIFIYGERLTPGEAADVAAAGAVVRGGAEADRRLLVRRMLGEIDADIYLVAHEAGPEDACAAPLAVSELEHGRRDLIDLAPLDLPIPRDIGDRLLIRTMSFLFGADGPTLQSDSKALSRRFVSSYRTTDMPDPPCASAGLVLTLHALRMRLPVGRVASLASPPGLSAVLPGRTPGDWMSLLGLIGRLLLEERPRRTLGLVSLGLMAMGIGLVLPAVTIHGLRATVAFAPGPSSALVLLIAGAAIGMAGVVLDSLASARQEIRRVAVELIPRRTEPREPQSSVS